MEKEGLNSALFADKIGVSRGTITHILADKPRNKPSLEVIQKILETFPAVSTDWLLTGKIPMYDHEKIFLHPQQESIVFDDENQTQNHPKNDTDAHKESKVSEYPLKSMDKEPVEIPQPIKLKEITNVTSSNRKIDKIIIFYDDKTFVNFLPEE